MKQKIFTIKCRLWVLKGALERGFNYKLLMKISDQYDKIGMVPSGYTYPLLSSEVSNILRRAKQAIHKVSYLIISPVTKRLVRFELKF